MIYFLPLDIVALAFGLLLAGGCAWVLWKRASALDSILALLRNDSAGYSVFVFAAAWFLALVSTVDLMEYSPYRPHLLLFFIALSVLTIIFLKEFILVRSLGGILLMGSQIMLDAAFMRHDPARFLVTVLAYAMIVKGMFLIASPYLLRDWISWLKQKPLRAHALATGGLTLGVTLFSFGLFVY